MIDIVAGDVVLILIAYSLGAIVKGAIGVGTPFIVVPMLAPTLGLPMAVAVLTFPLIVANVWQMWQFRSVAPALRFLPTFLLGAACGLGFGTYGLVTINAGPLMVFIGCAVMTYLVVNIALPNLRISAKTGVRLAPFTGLGAGMMQGLSGISAPISLTFLSALRLDRAQFVFSASSAFLVFGTIQFITLTVAGVMTVQVGYLSLLASVPTLLLMPVGQRLGMWLNARTFRMAVLGLLFLLSIRMIYQGIWG
jgi:uncharacterized membrane protein YfcA